MKRRRTTKVRKGKGSETIPVDDVSSFAPGSSRQQDSLVGPLTPEEGLKIAAKPLRMYRFLHWLLRAPLRLFFRVRREGHGNVPRRGGVILVVNHVSSFDPPVLLVSLRRIFVTLAKAGILANPVKRLFVETLGGMIRVDRSRGGNEAAVEAACAALGKGKILAVWPEGGRSPTGRLTRAHTGVARIALRTGAPVVPVAISGTFEKKAKHTRKIRWGAPVKIRFGEPIVLRARHADPEDREVLRSVTDEIMLEVARLQGPQEVDHYRRLVEEGVPAGVVHAPRTTAPDDGDPKRSPDFGGGIEEVARNR